MPRRDRTFSTADILRLIERNLTPEERQAVLEALALRDEKGFLKDLLTELTDFLPFVSTILDLGDVLGVFFDQADIDRSKRAAAFISDRRNQLADTLSGSDF